MHVKGKTMLEDIVAGQAETVHNASIPAQFRTARTTLSPHVDMG